VLTHLAWDELTELGGSGSDVLQHGSTVLGLVVLAVSAYRHRRVVRWHDRRVRGILTTTGILCALGAAAGAVVAGWSWLNPPSELTTGEVVEGVLTSGVTGAGVGLLATAVVLALAWWTATALRRTRPGS